MKRTRPALIAVHFALDADLVRRLDRLAAASCRFKVAIVEEALALYLNAWEIKTPMKAADEADG